MAISKTNKKLAIATTAALLISGCTSNSSTNISNPVRSDLGQCNGVNSCKGNGSCATANNSCAGQNSCKGKGWLPLTKSDCSARAGTFSKFKKK